MLFIVVGLGLLLMISSIILDEVIHPESGLISPLPIGAGLCASGFVAMVVQQYPFPLSLVACTAAGLTASISTWRISARLIRINQEGEQD